MGRHCSGAAPPYAEQSSSLISYVGAGTINRNASEGVRRRIDALTALLGRRLTGRLAQLFLLLHGL